MDDEALLGETGSAAEDLADASGSGVVVFESEAKVRRLFRDSLEELVSSSNLYVRRRFTWNAEVRLEARRAGWLARQPAQAETTMREAMVVTLETVVQSGGG